VPYFSLNKNVSIEVPFAAGSIFTVLNLQHELGPIEAVAKVRRQARRAIELGFDGVALSEHHAGFAGYLPQPLQMAGLLLAELPHGWAAPLPLVLPIRTFAGLVEEVAWLQAAYPGRVAIGCAAGYAKGDFDAYGLQFEDRFARFRELFEQFALALNGQAPSEMLSQDPAVRLLNGNVPLVMCSKGPKAVRLAARLGAGIAPVQLSDAGYRELFADYVAAGGQGPRIIQRWVVLGHPPQAEIDALNRVYLQAPGDHRWQDASSAIVPFSDADPERMAERLLGWLEASHGTVLCVRFHIGAVRAEVIDDQLERFGATVMPLLRKRLAAMSVASAG
jgi:alkanesulfonate monooxygenase SsuD/methylene tetrahydromethanopterin reductase-like flavin-dependent oxidoreductase (luciferase family)